MPSRAAFGQPTRQFIKIRSLPQAPEQYSKADQDAVRRFIELAFVETTDAEFPCCFHCQTGNPETVVSGTIGCIDQVTDAPLTTHPIWIKREADDGGMPPDDRIGWYGWNGLRGNRGTDTTFRIGDDAVVGNTSSYAIAFGEVASATSNEAIAIGHLSKVATVEGVAIGHGAEVKAGVDGGVAIGQGAIANKGSSDSLGDEDATIAIGATEAKRAGEINIGFTNINNGTSNSRECILIGQRNTLSGVNIGDAIAMGSDVVIDSDFFADVAIGSSAESHNGGNVVIGEAAHVNDSDDGFEGTAVGYNAEIQGDCCVAVGHDSQVVADFATAVGPNAVCGTGSPATVHSQVALGRNATATGHRASSLGTDTVASHQGAIAQGYGAQTAGANTWRVGSSTEKINQLEVVTAGGTVTIVF